jgi:hypothetical protein
MSWKAQQFKKPAYKRVRHAHIHFGVSKCQDCQRDLRATHEITRFSGRCRSCWSVSVLGSDLVLAGGW